MVVARIDGHKFEQRARYRGLRDPVSRQPPGARVRDGAARAEHPLRLSGGQSLFEKHRDQGHRRVPAPHRERRRRSRVPARGHHAEARHRADDARAARPRSRRSAHESLFAAVFAPELAAAVPATPARVARGRSARWSTDLRLSRGARAGRSACSTSSCSGIGYEAWLVDTLDKRDAQRTQQERPRLRRLAGAAKARPTGATCSSSRR